ncbi:MAG: hypothetical protein WBH57_09730 [Anaerolineae bacterium]
MEIVLDLELQLESSRVLQALGVPPGRKEKRLELVEELLPRGRELVEPVILYDLFPVEEVHPGEVVLEEVRLRSKGLAKLWGQAQEVALILCTIGPALDEQVSAYFVASDPLSGLVLDAIGTAALEELAEEACRLIAEVAKGKGWEASAPLSPGNLDWGLEEQRVFFDLLPAEGIGLRLKESYQMTPLKSLSLAMGLGEEVLPPIEASPCTYCSLGRRCRYRRT